jgi:predicted nucleotidyltransferase
LKSFEEVFEIDGVQVRTVNLEGLLRTKQSARGQDISDRMAIERALAAAKGRA